MRIGATPNRVTMEEVDHCRLVAPTLDRYFLPQNYLVSCAITAFTCLLRNALVSTAAVTSRKRNVLKKYIKIQELISCYLDRALSLPSIRIKFIL